MEMTKETKKVLEIINNDPEMVAKIDNLKLKYTNIREFYNQIGYVIMDLVTTNKSLYTINRSKIDLYLITERYFG